MARYGDGDCVIAGGTIHTLDPDRPSAEAVAIRDGRIVHVGDRAEAERQAGPKAERIDLAGRTAIPGFVESHSHPFLYGRNLENVDCRGAGSIAEVIERIRERAAVTPAGEWVKGHSLDDTLLAEQRHPTRHELDAATADHPVFVTHVSAHSACASSLALERAGIDAGTPDPAQGHLERNADGVPTGVLWEFSQQLVLDRLPPATQDDLDRQLGLAAERYLAAGVTSVVEMAVGLANDGVLEATALAGLAHGGGCPVRLGAAVMYPQWKRLRAGEGPGLDWGGDPARARPVGVKLFQDGSIQIGTAALTEPYLGSNEPADGHLLQSQDDYDRAVRDVHAAGWQLFTHANGDRAIDSVLDGYGQVLADGDGASRRHRIEHCQTAREDQLDRMARLGVPTSTFVAHVYYWGDRHRDRFLGPDRAARIDPLASMERRGIRFGLHNDTPVTPVSPLHSIATAVTRRTRDGEVLGAEQAISAAQGLRAMTLDSAWLAFEENDKGSLVAGKLGDVTVLDDDPLVTSADAIADIPVAMTIVGGRVAWTSR